MLHFNTGLSCNFTIYLYSVNVTIKNSRKRDFYQKNTLLKANSNLVSFSLKFITVAVRLIPIIRDL